MKINKSPYEERYTDCIQNHLSLEQSHEWLIDLVGDMKIRFNGGYKSSKEMFLKVFGKQQVCKNYEYRTWIWTFSNEEETSTVYCLVSKGGISWEMHSESDVNEILNLANEIRSRCENV